MSSNIRIKRVCQHCGEEFIAKTTSTQYCGQVCSKRAYKKRKREERIAESNNETVNTKSNLDVIKQKEFLTVRDASVLLSCSIRAVYYFIENKDIKATNLSERKTLIKRSEIDRLFEKAQVATPQPKAEVKKFRYKIEDCYTIGEVQKKFGVSDAALNNILKRKEIPRLKKGWYVYVPKVEIDKVLK
ncbi:MAG TPA: helix-turn-helix domain-containing protein [Bacteroidia bacterium]|jgi:excisionase family DNA binding protein|nr:helix-turn-helix domain-containing protein [Bacteroidia bacterium]